MASKCVINNHGSSVGVNWLQYLIGILLLGLIVAPFAAYSNEQIPLFDDEYTVQKYAFYPISAMSSEEADEYVGRSQWFYHGTAGGALYKCDGGFHTSHKLLTKAEVYSHDPVHKELGLNGNEFRLTTLKCGERKSTWKIVSTIDDSVVHYGLDGVLFKLVRVSETEQTGASTASDAERSDVIGKWEPLGRGHQAIYGSIEVNDTYLEWGVMPDKYPCKSKYVLTENEEQGSYLFTLTDKQCDYDHMQNGHYHKLLTSFEFQVHKNEQGELEARFIDYNKSGKSIGEGSFYKVETKR